MIVKLTQEQIEPFKKMAKAENLIFSEGTEYYGKIEDTILLGFVGLKEYPRKYMFKTDYVLKPYRGRGVYRELNDYRVKLVNDRGFKPVELYCTASSLPLHLKNGAKVIKEYKISTKVRYENL
jgi:hypothetical protein